MEMKEALDVIERKYGCEKNEDDEFCMQFPLDGGSYCSCSECPYEVKLKDFIEAMKAILVAHGRMKGGGEA